MIDAKGIETEENVENPILSVRDLRIGFSLFDNVLEVVKGVSFDVYPSTTVAIVGESGSGKSVTAQAIMGILPGNGAVLGGEILFDDGKTNTIIDLAQTDPDSPEYRDIRGGKISIIFQEPMTSLSPLHTIGDQVSEALFLHQNINKKDGLERTKEMLTMVGFPNADRAMQSYPFELSGGLRQRAMIAMALVCQPSIIIADEPTTALDVTIQAQIIDLLRSLQKSLKMAILLITHDLGVVANMADDIVVMYHGEIVEAGNARDLLERPQHPYLQCLLAAIPRFDMIDDERLEPLRAIDNSIGDYIRSEYEAKVKHKKLSNDDLILSVKNLSKFYVSNDKDGWFKQKENVIKAVNNLSLDIRFGESFGLVGESGCGKSTFSKLLMRAISPDSGEIRFHDVNPQTGKLHWLDVLNLSDEALMRFRRKIQYIFQDPFSSLNPRMTVFDILREPLLVHRIGNNKQHITIVKELMNMVGLDTRFVNRYPHSFSGGQRQRISIARALSMCPDILICDEPVSALDVSIQAQILNLFNDLRAQLGLTYIFISHNLAVVDYVADRVGVMSNGQLMEVAGRHDLFSDPQHPYTRLLLDSVPNINMDTPIEFQRIRDDKCDTPSHWPEAYRICDLAKHEGKYQPSLVEIAPKHWVRQNPV